MQTHRDKAIGKRSGPGPHLQHNAGADLQICGKRHVAQISRTTILTALKLNELIVKRPNLRGLNRDESHNPVLNTPVI